MENQPKVFMVHGFEGVPNGGWRPWLMAQLALQDIYACALPMPLPSTPTRDGWIKEIMHAVPTPNENIYLVGHSLGVSAILQYLKTLPEELKIGGAVLVSGPYHNVDDGYKEKLQSFFEPEYDFQHYKKVCKNFLVIHGDNDPVVPVSDAEEFSKALSCELIKIPNGGHLNGSSGHRELPAAFDALMRFIKG